MKLQQISLNRLQYVESGQFINRFLTDFDSLGLDPSEDPEFQLSYDSLKEQAVVYELALMQIRAKAASGALAQLDQVRDQKYATLRQALLVHRYTDDPAEKSAYTLIRIVLKTYRNLIRMNFEAETLAINTLLSTLRSAQYLPAIQTLGMENHITVLETANEAFKAIFDSRSTETITTTVYDTKMLRKTILNTYTELAQYCVIMAKRKNTPYYNQIVTAINHGRKYYADILAHRSGVADTTPDA